MAADAAVAAKRSLALWLTLAACFAGADWVEAASVDQPPAAGILGAMVWPPSSGLNHAAMEQSYLAAGGSPPAA